MVEVNEALTRKVANLARLELTDEEVRLFTHQIGNVLEYVAQLEKIDVSGVAPLTHPLESAAPLREDVCEPFGSLVDGGYSVPPII